MHDKHDESVSSPKSDVSTQLRRLSDWKVGAKRESKSTGEAKCAEAVSELIVKHAEFHSNVVKLQQMLLMIKDKCKLNKNEKEAVELYLQQTKEVLAIHLKALNPDEILPTNNDTILNAESLLENVNHRIQSDDFVSYFRQLGKFPSIYLSIANMYNAHYKKDKLFKSEEFKELHKPLDGFMDFAIMPIQLTPRYPLLLKAAMETLKDDSIREDSKQPPLWQLTKKSLDIIELETKKTNELVRLEEPVMALSSNKRATSRLRNFVTLGLKDEFGMYGSYVSETLPKIFPGRFQLNDKGALLFSDKKDKKVQQVNKALGLTTDTTPTTLNPAKFDAKVLDELYKNDKNPLWHVLKCAKPIDGGFTAKDKMQAYAQLAQALKKGEIGKTNKNKMAYEIVKAAKAMAEKYPEVGEQFMDKFGPKSSIGKWLIEKADNKPKKAGDKTERDAVNETLNIGILDDDEDEEIEEVVSSPSSSPENSEETIKQLRDEAVAYVLEEANFEIKELEKHNSPENEKRVKEILDQVGIEVNKINSISAEELVAKYAVKDVAPTAIADKVAGPPPPTFTPPPPPSVMPVSTEAPGKTTDFKARFKTMKDSAPVASAHATHIPSVLPVEPKTTPKVNDSTSVGVEPVAKAGTSINKASLINQVVNCYNVLAKNGGDYMKDYEEPKVDDNSAKLKFPDYQKATDFLNVFSQTHREGNFDVRNNAGQIVARVESGALKIYNEATKGFVTSDKDSVIPQIGMSEEDFKTYRSIPEPATPVSTPSGVGGELDEDTDDLVGAMRSGP